MHPVWRRLMLLVPLVLLVTGAHVWDAAKKGESLWVPMAAAAIPLAIIGAMGWHASRPVQGMNQKEAWAHQMGRLAGLWRWAAVAAVGIATLRAVAYLATLK
jgi:hypothetical protein